MPIDELIALKDRIERLVAEKAQAEKKVLLAKLEAIRRFEAKASSRTSAAVAEHKTTRKKAAAKYRNPITGETWAGRGLHPTWMRKAIEAGHSAEEFRIGDAELRKLNSL
jgi:DNA-binding protein H-NS